MTLPFLFFGLLRNEIVQLLDCSENYRRRAGRSVHIQSFDRFLDFRDTDLIAVSQRCQASQIEGSGIVVAPDRLPDAVGQATGPAVARMLHPVDAGGYQVYLAKTKGVAI